MSAKPIPSISDNQAPELFGQTPWQTVGPFFHYGLPWKGGADLIGNSDIGARPELFPPEHYLLREAATRGALAGPAIEITGTVTDGAGNPVPDAMVEIWQADAAGTYPEVQVIAQGEGFIGFGRSSTSEAGLYRFLTIMPGRVPGPGNTLQAPHVAVGVMGRGLIKRLTTRLYFEDGEGLAQDPILELVPPERRTTLMARRISQAPTIYRFDIVLQGAAETVFFDF